MLAVSNPEKWMVDIQLHEKARGILTAEQQQKLRTLEYRMMGRMGAGMRQGMMPGAEGSMRGMMRGPKMQ